MPSLRGMMYCIDWCGSELPHWSLKEFMWKVTTALQAEIQEPQLLEVVSTFIYL